MTKSLIGLALVSFGGLTVATDLPSELPYSDFLNSKRLNSDESLQQKSLEPQLDFDYSQVSPVDALSEIQPAIYQLTAPEQGQWSVSFDFNSLDSLSNYSQASEFSVETDFSSADQRSKFYINYGNRRVPVSISFEDPATTAFKQGLSGNDYTGQALARQRDTYQLGMSQQLDNQWAVSVNYLTSDYQTNSNNFALDGQASNYLLDLSFDKNELNYQLPASLGQQSAYSESEIDAIEIKVSRKLDSNILVGAQYQQLEAASQYQPYTYNASIRSQLDAEQLSLFGEYSLSDNWSMGASIDYTTENSQTPLNLDGKFDASASHSIHNNVLDNTTLDIGLQYQSQLDQMGLVIRIDLVNLFGQSSFDQQLGYSNGGLDDKGLMPYTFQTPKYIKLSGSINF